jgi:hypothetical protein
MHIHSLCPLKYIKDSTEYQQSRESQSFVSGAVLGSVEKLDLASSGLFSACLHPAVSTIQPTSPASPSLAGEKTLALGPTTEFSDRA